MAYRLEKEQNGDYAVVIDGWVNGIAPDPYSGLNQVLTANLETPGEISAGYSLTSATITGATLGIPISDSTRFFPTYATPAAQGTGAAQSYAVLDASGQVFEATSITGTWNYLASGASTTGASSLDGIAYWLGYLFKFRSSNLDYWDGTTWHNAWKTSANDIVPTIKHFCFVATNNELYFTNGHFVGRISAPDPTLFDPTNAATYSFNAEILAIPYSDVSISLAEVGGGTAPQSTLLVGGSFNAVYPWDKISTSYSLPINVADGYIKNMVSVNQNAFIFPGNTGGRGRIYITNGAQAELFFKIPDYITGEQDPYFEWGDAIFHRNNLIFGFFPTKNSGSGVISSIVSRQIWALNLETKAFRSISVVPTVSGKANAKVLIAGINPSTAGFSYITAIDDNSSSPEIRYSASTAGVGSSSFITDLMPVGSFVQKKTFNQLEFKLRSPLQSGESLIIAPIVDGVELAALTFSPTPTTGSISGYASVNFQNAQWVQFTGSLIGNSATSGVRLTELRLR